MNREREFDALVVSAIPALERFARKLCRDGAKADDLVSDTVAKALAKHNQFQRGTNIKAWLFTIMRNEFMSQARKRGRETEDPDGILVSHLSVPAGQPFAYDLKIVLGFMEQLSDAQRVCLELLYFDRLSLEEIADLIGVPIGTVKSTASRARWRLLELLGEVQA